VRYKEYFPVKPFRQRYDEQDRSRKKSDQIPQDEFGKIAGNQQESECATIVAHALSFYKFISAKNSKSAQAVKRHACLLLFATFSFKKRKSW
jgi:uncharacterized protein YfbU (UPF0304 family)